MGALFRGRHDNEMAFRWRAMMALHGMQLSPLDPRMMKGPTFNLLTLPGFNSISIVFDVSWLSNFNSSSPPM